MILQIQGAATAGRRFTRRGRTYEVVEVLKTEFWTEDRIEDEDAFDLTPGEYSTVNAEEVAAPDRSARVAAAAAAKKKQEEDEAAFEAKRDELTAGLVKAGERRNLGFPEFQDAKPELALQIAGKNHGGGGWTRKLTLRRDGSGRVVAVEEDFSNWNGPRIWLRPELSAQSDALYRTRKFWIPGAFGPESYPGPAVPESELTEAELTEVRRLESARAEAEAARQARWAKK